MSRCLVLCLFLAAIDLARAGVPGLDGTWKFIPSRSTDIAFWGNSQPRISLFTPGDSVRMIWTWLERERAAYADSFAFRPGTGEVTSIVRSLVWPENWFMGVLSGVGKARTVSGLWLEPGRALRVVSRQMVLTSQGEAPVTTTRDYALAPDGRTLTVTEKRSSRPSPVILIFEREASSP